MAIADQIAGQNECRIFKSRCQGKIQLQQQRNFVGMLTIYTIKRWCNYDDDDKHET